MGATVLGKIIHLALAQSNETHTQRKKSQHKKSHWLDFLFPGPKHNSICSLYEEILFLGVQVPCVI